MVWIDEVIEKSLKVPIVKKENGHGHATLGGFGAVPFNIILPGTML